MSQEDIINVLKARGDWMFAWEVAERVDIHKRNIYNGLGKLYKHHLIEREPVVTESGRIKFRFRLVEDHD